MVVLVVLLAFLANLKFRQYREQRAIEKLKNDLLEQQAALMQKNQELSNSITYLNSDEFKQQVARQQLNLQKNGELVYNFTKKNVQLTATPTEQQTQQSNAQKWWNYFFHTN